MLENQNPLFAIYCTDNQNANEKKRIRRPFSEKEDQKLRKLVHKFGEVNAWKKIADRMKGRNIRQCRERWSNTLSEKVTKSKWSQNEDNLLLQKYDELGPKWKKMESFFPGRIQYQIRNRFKTLSRIKKQKILDDEPFGDFLDDENDNDYKNEIPNLEKNETPTKEAIKNIIAIFPVPEHQKKGEKLDILKNRINSDEDFFEFENYWSHFSF